MSTYGHLEAHTYTHRDAFKSAQYKDICDETEYI